jgi:hypothetical protein
MLKQTEAIKESGARVSRHKNYLCKTMRYEGKNLEKIVNSFE